MAQLSGGQADRVTTTSAPHGGFTIVELLIVVVVIAILAAITIVAYNGISHRAKHSAAASAAGQAAKKVMAYATLNADQYPAAIADAGLSDGSTTYQYRADNNANPKTFCLTSTSDNVSYFVSNGQSSPTPGACAGHGANGAGVITNLARNPRAQSPSGGEWTSRYSMTPSFVSGAIDGPIPVASNYFRQTYVNATSGSARGVDIRGNLDVPTPPSDTSWPVSGSSPVTVSIYLRSSVSNNIYLACRVHDGNGIWLAAPQSAAPTPYSASMWQRISYRFTPAAAAFLACTARFQSSVTWPAGSTIDATGLMITDGNTLHTYADGSSTSWIWNGTPNAATSTGPAL